VENDEHVNQKAVWRFGDTHSKAYLISAIFLRLVLSEGVWGPRLTGYTTASFGRSHPPRK
jgi:hypothetical protein